MNKLDKAFLLFKTDNKNWFRKQLVQELVGILVSNGATEDDVSSFRRKVEREIDSKMSFIDSKSKSQKEVWKNDILEAYDMAFVEHFSDDVSTDVADVFVSSYDKEAMLTGYESFEHKLETMKAYTHVNEEQRILSERSMMCSLLCHEYEIKIHKEKDPEKKKLLAKELLTKYKQL